MKKYIEDILKEDPEMKEKFHKLDDRMKSINTAIRELSPEELEELYRSDEYNYFLLENNLTASRYVFKGIEHNQRVERVPFGEDRYYIYHDDLAVTISLEDAKVVIKGITDTPSKIELSAKEKETRDDITLYDDEEEEEESYFAGAVDEKDYDELFEQWLESKGYGDPRRVARELKRIEEWL